MPCIGERIFHSFHVHLCIMPMPLFGKDVELTQRHGFGPKPAIVVPCPFPVRIIAAFYHLMTTWLGLGSALEPREEPLAELGSESSPCAVQGWLGSS